MSQPDTKGPRMLTSRQKSLLHALLGMVLLFVGVATSFSIAVDDDGDDSTPPVVVQLNVDAQKKVFIEAGSHIMYPNAACECSQFVGLAVVSLEQPPVPGPGTGLSEVLVPLRT